MRININTEQWDGYSLPDPHTRDLASPPLYSYKLICAIQKLASVMKLSLINIPWPTDALWNVPLISQQKLATLFVFCMGVCLKNEAMWYELSCNISDAMYSAAKPRIPLVTMKVTDERLRATRTKSQVTRQELEFVHFLLVYGHL